MHRAVELLTVGYRAGRNAGVSAAVHRWALVVASAAAVLTCWLFVTAGAVSSASAERVLAREPVFVSEGAESTAVAQWMIHSDFLDNRQFLVFYISPSRLDAPPPPGLPRWPEPGGAFLSPELLRDPGAARLKERFGHFSGVIGEEGLASRTERLIYYRPLTDRPFADREGRVAISRFGVDPDAVGADYFPTTFDDFGKWTMRDLYVVAAFVVVLPTMLLLVLAVRSNAERRDRRLAMLDALGAPASARAWVLAGEAALPVGAGSVAGGVIALAATFADWRVPITGYVVPASDVSTVRPLVVPLVVAVSATVIGLVLLTQLRRGARGETRPRTLRLRFRGWLQAVFPVALALAVWGASTARADGGVRYSPGLIVFLIAAVAVLASLPSVLGSAAAASGRLIARLGAKANSTGAIVGGRWLRQRPALVARLCAAFVVGLGLLVQVQVQQAWIIQQTRGLANGSTPANVEIGDRLLILRTGADRTAADRFTAEIGADHVLRVIDFDGRSVLAGTCRALEALGDLHHACARDPEPIDSAYEHMNVYGQVVREGTLISDPDFLVIADPAPRGETVGFFVLNGRGVDGAELVSRAAYANLSKPYVSTAGQHWLSGGLAGAAVFDWVLSLGTAGLVLLALAGALSAAGMFLSHAHSLGVLGTYSADRRLYLTIAGWNLGIPLIAAGAVGSVTAAFLGYLTLQIRRVGSISFEVLGIGLAVVALLAIMLTLLCGLAAARSVRSWQPTAD